MVKDNVSRDVKKCFLHNGGMVAPSEQQEFEQQLRERLARLRNERRWSQQQMATALAIPFERYKKYETRSVLPLYLVPRLALMVDRSIAYVLTGREEAQRQPGYRLPEAAE